MGADGRGISARKGGGGRVRSIGITSNGLLTKLRDVNQHPYKTAMKKPSEHKMNANKGNVGEQNGKVKRAEVRELGVKKAWIVAIVIGVHLAVLLPLLLHYIPTGHNGVFYYYYRTGGEKHEFWPFSKGVAGLPITSDTHLTVIIHGFSESSHRPWIHRLTDALLSVGGEERVVVVVDYWDLHTINYLQMRHNSREVASLIAHLIDSLVIHNNLQLAHTHLIGFSLGGRISGMVGSRLTTGKVGRITALDPSYPFLHPVDLSESLDQSDAQLVVVLRTSLVAYYNPPGHVDFFPNGGIVQPGCDIWFYPDIVQQSCSHFRAVQLGVEAARQQHVFPSCACTSWNSFVNKSCDCLLTNNFNLATYSSVGGLFYLTTNSDPPYTIPLE